MRKRILLLALFGLIISGCGGGSGSNSGGGSSSTQPQDLENLIVVIGDSIGFGVGSAVSFADLIQSITSIPVTNVSVPGASAEEGAGRVPGLISSLSPRYLVVLLGTNNAAGAGGGTAGAINSLNLIAQLANDAGVIPVIGTLPYITRSIAENGNTEAISGAIRGIGGARIADNRAVMNGSHIGSDGFHPNTLGHDLMANVFAAQIF